MSVPAGFVPRQAMAFDEKLFAINGAEETLTIAEHEMTLLPPFPEGATIHDAACGLGPVTQSILSNGLPDSATVSASDIAPPMVQMYNKVAEVRGWSARAVVMDAQSLAVADASFSHVFLSFGLPIIENPAAAAREMYRTLRPGGTAITAFWLQIPQGENAQATRRALWGPDAHLDVEPNPQHKDHDYKKSLLMEAGFPSENITIHQKSAFLPVKNLHEFATAIWSAIGKPVGGWTHEDEEKWDSAIEKYQELLVQRPGCNQDREGNITLEAIAQIVIARKHE